MCFYYCTSYSAYALSKIKSNEYAGLDGSLLKKDEIYNRVYNNIKNSRKQKKSFKKINGFEVNSNSNTKKLMDSIFINGGEFDNIDIDFVAALMQIIDSILLSVKQGDFDSWIEHEYYSKFINEFVQYNRNLNVLTKKQLNMLTKVILIKDVGAKRAIIEMALSYVNTKSSLQSLFKFAYEVYIKYYKWSKSIPKQQSTMKLDFDAETAVATLFQFIPDDVHELVLRILRSNSVSGKASTKMKSQFVTLLRFFEVLAPYFEQLDPSLQDFIIELSIDEDERDPQVVDNLVDKLASQYEHSFQKWLHKMVNEKIDLDSIMENSQLGAQDVDIALEMKQDPYLKNLEAIRVCLIEYLPQLEKLIVEFCPNYEQVLQKRREIVETIDMDTQLRVLSQCNTIEDYLAHFETIVLSKDYFQYIFGDYQRLLTFVKASLKKRVPYS